MIIHAKGGAELAVFVSDLDVTLVVQLPGGAAPVMVRISANHCQALELAVTAARLEADARAVGGDS